MSDAVLLKDAVRADLEEAAGRSGSEGVRLSSMTTIGCGGPATFLIEAENSARLAAILEVALSHDLPWFVLGLGSNLLVSDEGWQGIVIKLSGDLRLCKRQGSRLECGGGAPLPKAAAAAAGAGLAGLEPLAGIPGTVGGAVAMNAGAFGSSIGELVEEVEICLPGQIKLLGNNLLEFGYRRSNLPAGSVVSKVTLSLVPADPGTVNDNLLHFRRRRESSQPVGKRTCGSVFKNPVGEKSAGELLDLAGCKGLSSGGAVVSHAHANFIINSGGATAADVVNLMNICRRRVHERFGVALEPEVKLLGNIYLDPLDPLS